MELSDRLVEAYARVTQPEAAPEAQAEVARRLRQRFQIGDEDPANIRVAVDNTGQFLAALRVVPYPDRQWLLLPICPEAGVPIDAPLATYIVGDAMSYVRARNGRRVQTRVELTRLTDAYRQALLGAGLKETGIRVEFKTPIANLPNEAGTPVSWTDLSLAGMDIVADVLARSAVGDPHAGEERENPRAAIQAWLAEPMLTTGNDCVHLGSVEGTPVAFCMAQVEPERGWARITYMGLVPEARRRGLGVWVHRHGFEMMRRQGGKLYHGGTAEANTPMLQLFRHHGCQESARLTEWEWPG
jgi:GNAT superfamily N-acetyltransferase